jgi:hypothetical protein
MTGVATALARARVVFAMLSLTAVAAQVGVLPEKLCGPPNYCARSDVRVEPYLKGPPALGPAGSIVSDPNFGSRMIRVTDTKTDSRRPSESYSTPSSAEQNSWNTDDTRFYVRGIDGAVVVFDFNPSTMAVHPIGPPNVSWIAEPQFSYLQPNILFGITSGRPMFQQYDIVANRTTDVNDASKCVKLKSSDAGHAISLSADDQRMAMVMGPEQDTDYLVYVYDRAKGCRWYNTRTGEIGGQWGDKGTISLPDRYLIHDARLNKSGRFIEITRSGASLPGVARPQNPAPSFIWNVDAMEVAPCGPKGCKGHHALGYSHLLNPSEQEHPMDLWIRPLHHLDATSPLIKQLPALQGWYDLHISWNNVNADDSNPACLSTYRRDNPNTPGAPLQVVGPWENEILCVETDRKDSKVWRFAHTYSTAQNGFWSSPRGNVSQDGRFYMFTSDWEDQLGQVRETSSYRTDVFIVELK